MFSLELPADEHSFSVFQILMPSFTPSVLSGWFHYDHMFRAWLLLLLSNICEKCNIFVHILMFKLYIIFNIVRLWFWNMWIIFLTDSLFYLVRCVFKHQVIIGFWCPFLFVALLRTE
jgi:hypothetical protein